MVVEGSFREDLYYRLNVLNLIVPPLRERGRDILLLAEHFLRQACAQIQRSPCRLALATHPLLLGNRWAGNVRQLQNVIFRAAAISEGEVIDCDDLELAGTALNSQQPDTPQVTSLEAAVQGFEKSLLETMYAAYPSTRQLAVRLQTSHTAIGQRLRKYGIASRVS
ncbi:Transcriptional regulatory protein TyrR [compost metagenome]